MQIIELQQQQKLPDPFPLLQNCMGVQDYLHSWCRLASKHLDTVHGPHLQH